MLDRQKDYAPVIGSDPNVFHSFEQGGKCFNPSGYEMDCKTGDLLEFPKGYAKPPVLDDPVVEEPVEMDVEPANIDPDMAKIEIRGDVEVIDIKADNYVSKREITDALDKLGVEYLRRDTRPQLLDRLNRALDRYAEDVDES